MSLRREDLTGGQSAAVPVIETGGRPMRDITTDAVRALSSVEHAPDLYQRGGVLVRVRCDENGRPMTDHLTEDQLRGMLERAAAFERTTKTGTTPVPPPLHIVRDIAALGTWPFRRLAGITETPALRANGTVLFEPGYDLASHLVHVPARGLVVRRVARHPSDAARRAAAALLFDELLGDFPFATPASRANALALVLTPIVRPAISGQVPLAAIVAPKAGNGKGLLGDSAATIATGRPAAVFPAPTREEEWSKALFAVVLNGSAFVLIDEVSELASPSLAAVLTASTYEGRLLGRSQTAQVPQRATWAVTGNNIRIGGDLARRCYEIRLDAKVSRPWTRDGFRHPNLLAWTAENRADLLAALLTLARAWWAADCPPADVPTIGGFDEWARIIGGILAHANVEGFLGNLDSFYEHADSDAAEWEAFLAALASVYRDQPFKVGDLADRLRHDPRLRDALPADLAEVVGQPTASFKARLGKALGRKDGTRYGDRGLRIERAGQDTRSAVTTWRIGQDPPVAEVHRSHRSVHPRYAGTTPQTLRRVDAHTSATSAPLHGQTTADEMAQ